MLLWVCAKEHILWFVLSIPAHISTTQNMESKLWGSLLPLAIFEMTSQIVSVQPLWTCIIFDPWNQDVLVGLQASETHVGIWTCSAIVVVMQWHSLDRACLSLPSFHHSVDSLRVCEYGLFFVLDPRIHRHLQHLFPEGECNSIYSEEGREWSSFLCCG